MNWQELASQLFPGGHDIQEQDHFLSGTARVGEQTVAVIGTTDHTPIGIEIALAQAQAVLAVVREHPRRSIVILVDTQGQRLRHRDEMLGINSYMAHLGKCIDLARRRGHRVIGLVYDQALSGGFITSGLMADACYALPQATIRVMGLPAMARITKVPEERLVELAKDNPVFAPGARNYLAMGGVEAIWDGDLAAQLEQALTQATPQDRRAELGAPVLRRCLRQRLLQLRGEVAVPDRFDAAHGQVVAGARREDRIVLCQFDQPFLGHLGDARHRRQSHHADGRLRQRIAGVCHQAAGDEAARQGLVVHQPDHPVAAPARKIDAFAEMRHVAVDAQHFIAVAQALALGIDQDHDGAPRMFAHHGKHRLRLGQCDFDADRRVVRGADHGHGLFADAGGARQEVILLLDVMPAGKELRGQFLPVHVCAPVR